MLIILATALYGASFFMKEKLWGFAQSPFLLLHILLMLFGVSFLILVTIPSNRSLIQNVVENISLSLKKYSFFLRAIISGLIFSIFFYLFRIKSSFADPWVLHGVKAATLICENCPQDGLRFYGFTSELFSALAHSFIIKLYLLSGGLYPVRIVALVSVFFGVLFVIILYYFSDKVGSEVINKFLFFMLIISPGYIMVFFGYKELIPYAFPFVLAYFFTSYLYVDPQKKGYNVTLFWPTFCLAISMLMHLSSGFFGPSLLYLYYLEWIKMRDLNLTNFNIFKILSLESFKGGFLPVLLSAALSQVVLKNYGYSIFSFGTGDLSLSWFSSIPKLLTLSNLLKYINIQFLIANISILAIILIVIFQFNHLKKDNYFVFSLWAIVLLQIFAFSWNTGLHSIKFDWDLWSLSAIPLVVTLAYSVNTYLSKEKALQIGSLLIVFSLFCTTPWIYYNSIQSPFDVVQYTSDLEPMFVEHRAWDFASEEEKYLNLTYIGIIDQNELGERSLTMTVQIFNANGDELIFEEKEIFFANNSYGIVENANMVLKGEEIYNYTENYLAIVLIEDNSNQRSQEILRVKS